MTSAPLRTALPAAKRGPERRSNDPLAVLSRHLNQDCLHALQPQELAAILEAEGYTDALIQERYGDSSVFACAERLFRLVPYRPPTLARPAVPTLRPGHIGRDLLRGVIYLLPAVWSPAVLALGWNGTGGNGVAVDASQSTSLSNIQGAGLGLLISSFFGWGWMQSVAYLGYLGLATSPAETSRMLRWAGAGAVALTGVLAALVAWALGQDPVQVGVVALGIACYLAAATALLVLSSEVLLVISLLPALTWMGLQAAFSGGVVPDNAPHQAAAVLALAVGLPVVAALYASQPALIGAMQAAAARARGVVLAVPSARRLGRGAWRRALPHAGYGWLCAGFLSLALLHPFAPSGDSAGMLGLSWSLAPLVLSMGVLELSVRRIHAALKQQAGTTGTVSSIVRGSAWQVLKVCLQYAALLFIGYVLARLLAPQFGFQRPSWLLITGHLEVATALLLSALLINFGALYRVLGAWALALAAQLALLLGHLDVVGSYALSAGGVLALLLVLMWLALTDIRNLG